MRLSTRLVVCFVALSATAHADRKKKPPPLTPKQVEAKTHLDAGTQFFNVQQYDKAADEYQQAYILDPKPEYLYAAGQAQRMAGDCTKAIRSYEAFLRTNPPQTEQAKAQKNIDRCGEDVKSVSTIVDPNAVVPPEDKEALPAPPPPPPEEPVVAPPPPPPPPEPSYVLGHIMLATGIIAAGGGGYLFIHGKGTIDDNNNAATYNDFATGRSGTAIDDAKKQQLIGLSAAAGGVALITGAILYYVFHGGDEEMPVSATVTGGGAMTYVTGRF
jgi:tetratricopeptide (TPR) repeat protein